MIITKQQLQEQARMDMKNYNGEIGFAESIIDEKLVLITAKKWGANKPGIKEQVRYTETIKAK